MMEMRLPSPVLAVAGSKGHARCCTFSASLAPLSRWHSSRKESGCKRKIFERLGMSVMADLADKLLMVSIVWTRVFFFE